MDKIIDQMCVDPECNDAEQLQALYEKHKPAPKDKVLRITPDKPTPEQKIKASQHFLVESEADDKKFYLNPCSKKWTNASSAVGKLLLRLLN